MQKKQITINRNKIEIYMKQRTGHLKKQKVLTLLAAILTCFGSHFVTNSSKIALFGCYKGGSCQTNKIDIFRQIFQTFFAMKQRAVNK